MSDDAERFCRQAKEHGTKALNPLDKEAWLGSLRNASS
jgi:hypothetical protein